MLEVELKKQKYLENIKTEKGRERTRQMLSHAIDTFIELGYEGTSLTTIINKSGGSRTTIYQCFGNKEGLFVAALEMMTDDLYRECISGYRHGRTLIEDLTGFGEIFLTAITTPRAVGALRLVYTQAPVIEGLGKWFYEEAFEASYKALAKILENHIEATVEELTPMAGVFVESLKGRLFHKALCVPGFQPDQEEIKTEVALCVEMLVASIRLRYPERLRK
ncbi:MAG: TetR/AcrR family transcriptional regulator [Sutterellaceae bacterium]|nr:TetR/AcrR family transcriptional regulator [Sutterellaceae bacterium]